jgi:hypothetical protein
MFHLPDASTGNGGCDPIEFLFIVPPDRPWKGRGRNDRFQSLPVLTKPLPVPPV